MQEPDKLIYRKAGLVVCQTEQRPNIHKVSTLCIVFMPLRQAQSRREILEYAFGHLVVRRMSKVYFGCGYFRVTQFHSLQDWLALLCCVAPMAWPGLTV